MDELELFKAAAGLAARTGSNWLARRSLERQFDVVFRMFSEHEYMLRDIEDRIRAQEALGDVLDEVLRAAEETALAEGRQLLADIARNAFVGGRSDITDIERVVILRALAGITAPHLDVLEWAAAAVADDGTDGAPVRSSESELVTGFKYASRALTSDLVRRGLLEDANTFDGGYDRVTALGRYVVERRRTLRSPEADGTST